MLAFLFGRKTKPVSAHVKIHENAIKKEAAELVNNYASALTASGFADEASFWRKKYHFVFSTNKDKYALLRQQQKLHGYMSTDADKWTLLHTILTTGDVGQDFIRFYGATTQQQQSVITLLMAAAVEGKFDLWRMLAEKCWGPSAHFQADTKHWQSAHHNFMQLIPFFLYHLLKADQHAHCDFLLKHHPDIPNPKSKTVSRIDDDNDSDADDDDKLEESVSADRASSASLSSVNPLDVLSEADVQLMFILACHDIDIGMMTRLLSYAKDQSYSLFDAYSTEDYKLRDFAGTAVKIGKRKFSFQHAKSKGKSTAACATIFLDMSAEAPVHQGTPLQVILTQPDSSRQDRDAALTLLQDYDFPWQLALQEPYLLYGALRNGINAAAEPLAELFHRLAMLDMVRQYHAADNHAAIEPSTSASSSSSSAPVVKPGSLVPSMRQLQSTSNKDVATNIFYELSLFMLNHAQKIANPKDQVKPFDWALNNGAPVNLWHTKVNDTVGSAWLLACFANLHFIVAEFCNRLDDAKQPTMDYNHIIPENGRPMLEWLLVMIAAPEKDTIWQRLGGRKLAPKKSTLPSHYDGLIALFLDALDRDNQLDTQDAQSNTMLLRIVNDMLPKHLSNLLAKNPNIQLKNTDGQQVMHVLASSRALGAVDKFSLLYAHTASFAVPWAWADELDNDQRCPLHIACEHARYSLIKKLLAYPGVNFANNMLQLTPDRNTVLMLLANNPNLTDSQCAELIQTMLQIPGMPALVHQANDDDMTCLHTIVKRGRVQSLRVLMPHNPRLHVAGQALLMPLLFHYDASNQDSSLDEVTLRKRKDASRDKMLPLLKQMGLDVDEVDADGNTLLHNVLQNKNPEAWTSNIESCLLEAGADVTKKSGDGMTPMMLLEAGQGAKKPRPSKVLKQLRQRLVAAGDHVDNAGNDGSSALHYYAMHVTSAETVPLRGRYDIQNAAGLSATHVLVANSQVNISLLNAVFHLSGDPSAVGKDGMNAFDYAEHCIKQRITLTPEATAQRKEAKFKLQECRNAWTEYHRKYIAAAPAAPIAAGAPVPMLPMPKKPSAALTWANLLPAAASKSTKVGEKASLLAGDSLASDDGYGTTNKR